MATSPGLSTTWGREDCSTTLIEALILQSALLRAGASRVTTDARVVHVPRLKVQPAAAWVAELPPIPRDSGDADMLVLVPRKVANVLNLRHRAHRGRQHRRADAVGNAMVKGVGASRSTPPRSRATRRRRPRPPGCCATRCRAADAGGVVDIDGILDAVGADPGHGGAPDTVFANPADITAIRKLKSTQGVYLLAPDGASVEGAPATRVGGCQLIPTNGLAAGKALVC